MDEDDQAIGRLPGVQRDWQAVSDNPVPHFPSVDGAQLAVVLRGAQWTLDELAHDLPAGRATPQRLVDLAAVLDQLAAMLRARAGIAPGEADRPGSAGRHERRDG